MVKIEMSRDDAERVLDALLAASDPQIESAIEAIAFGCGMVKSEEQYTKWRKTFAVYSDEELR